MTQDSNITCTAKTLKAIANPLRLKILCALNENELSVNEILKQSGSSQSNISQHLKYLRKKNLLSSRRDANRVYYRISKIELISIIKMMQKIYCQTEI